MLTLTLQGQEVGYYPLVIKACGKIRLLGLHKSEDWQVVNPETGEVVLDVSAYSHGRPYSSAGLNLNKARIYARRDLATLILAMGEAAFCASLEG